MPTLAPPPLSIPQYDSNGNMVSVWKDWYTYTYQNQRAVEGSFAPLDASYILQTGNSDLTNEQILANLSSGFVKVTSGSGVLTSTGSNTLSTSDIADEAITTPKLSVTGILSGAYGNASKTLTAFVGVDGRLTDIQEPDISITASQLNDVTISTGSTLSGSHTGTSSGTNTGDQNVFQTIAISGQSDVVADSTTDTLNLAAGAKISLTTNAGSDTITIATTGAAASGANSDITSLTGLTGTIKAPTSIQNSGGLDLVGFTTDSLANYGMNIAGTPAGFRLQAMSAVGAYGTSVIVGSWNGYIGVQTDNDGGFLVSDVTANGKIGLQSLSTGAYTYLKSANPASDKTFTLPDAYPAVSGYAVVCDTSGNLSFAPASGGSYTDEEAQDAVGTILTDSSTIDFTYNDATPSIAADVKSGSITNAMLAGSIDLTTKVTGDLPLSNLAQGSALSVLGVTGSATADNASIAAGSDHQVLRRSGTSVAFGSVNLAQSAAVTGTLPVANGGNGVTNIPSVSAYSSTATTLVTAGVTKITLNSEEYDIGSYFDTSTSRYTPGIAGIYHVSASVYVDNAKTSTIYGPRVYKNGSLYKDGFFGTTTVAGELVAQVTCDVKMNGSTDYLEFYCYQSNVTFTANVPGDQRFCFFDVHWVGPGS